MVGWWNSTIHQDKLNHIESKRFHPPCEPPCRRNASNAALMPALGMLPYGAMIIFCGCGIPKPMAKLDGKMDKTAACDMELRWFDHWRLQCLLQELLEKLGAVCKAWQKVGFEQVLRGNGYPSRYPVWRLYRHLASWQPVLLPRLQQVFQPWCNFSGKAFVQLHRHTKAVKRKQCDEFEETHSFCLWLQPQWGCIFYHQRKVHWQTVASWQTSLRKGQAGQASTHPPWYCPNLLLEWSLRTENVWVVVCSSGGRWSGVGPPCQPVIWNAWLYPKLDGKYPGWQSGHSFDDSQQKK